MSKSNVKSIALEPNTRLSFKLCINIFISILAFGIFSGCMELTDSTVDTGRLTDACQSQLLPNEFLVKFKHEANYRKVKATDSKEFLDTVVNPMKDKIEHYGLNFKFTQPTSTQVKGLSANRFSEDPMQKLILQTQFEPWVKALSRAEFLTSQGFLGQGIKVAVIDTGLDLNSSLFKDNVRGPQSNSHIPFGYNVAENNYDVQDYNGHGTMVSSLIAGPTYSALNEIQFEGGLAPKAQIVPIKIFSGGSRTTDLATILKSLDYAIDQNVDIINASWGGSDNCSALLENKLFDVWAKGILFVTSAGDNSKDLTQEPDYPASFNIPSMIVVSAINKRFEIPSRANIGGLVNLFAPGQDVPVLGLNGQIQLESGTSLASAVAAGGAALLKSAFPGAALSTLSYALSHGSSIENPTASMNTIDLKSSYFYMTSRHILPHTHP